MGKFLLYKHKISQNSTIPQNTPAGLSERYLPFQYYIRTEVHADKARKNKSLVSCTYKRNKHNFASVCFFSFKIKQQDLSFRKGKKSERNLSEVYCSFRTDLLPNTFLSRGCKDKLSDACDVA